MALQSGQNGKVVVGGMAYNVTGWEFSPEIDTLDTTNSASDGFEETITGITKATGNFKADLPQSGALPSLGTKVAVSFYDYLGAVIVSGYAWITSHPLTSEVKGKISYTCQLKFTGSFVSP
jgi:hypothetical protein